MGDQLTRLQVKNFKSLADVSVECAQLMSCLDRMGRGNRRCWKQSC